MDYRPVAAPFVDPRHVIKPAPPLCAGLDIGQQLVPAAALAVVVPGQRLLMQGAQPVDLWGRETAEATSPVRVRVLPDFALE